MNYLFDRIASEIKLRQLLYPLDVLLVGATGVGKSSTINAIFGEAKAKVGNGCEPETQTISAFRAHEYFRIHDSAGLGDGKANDANHAKNITQELLRTVSLVNDPKLYGFTDLVMVILDGGGRDMGTTYQLLQNVILPVFDEKRVMVVVNQADMAMKGRYWNYHKRCPEPQLLDFLEQKVNSVRDRLKEATGITIRKPVYYSAEYGYNLDGVVRHIIDSLPSARRVIQVDNRGNWIRF